MKSNRMILDLSKFTPEQAAKTLYKWVCAQSLLRGQKPAIECALWSPEEAVERGYGVNWRVSWESGPFEWAVCMSLGGRLEEAERFNYAYNGVPEVVLTSEHWFVEPHYSFDLGFIPTTPDSGG